MHRLMASTCVANPVCTAMWLNTGRIIKSPIETGNSFSIGARLSMRPEIDLYSAGESSASFRVTVAIADRKLPLTDLDIH